MQIKRIKLSPKRGGNGFVSSFSVNIGSQEARDCGLFFWGKDNQVVVKIIDPEKQEIVIKAKEYTLTNDVINTVISYSEYSRKLHREKMESLSSSVKSASDVYVVELASVPFSGIHTDNEYANRIRELNQEFGKYLLSLPLETITDIITLMYMGQGQDANMRLPWKERFIDYWVYLSDIGCFSAPTDGLVMKIMEKATLAEYLRQGLDILNQPSRVEEDEDYDEW